MGVHRLDRAEARAIAVRAHVLHAQRPTDPLMVVRLLTLLQIDPTAAIAPSAYLVAWSRLGSSYQPTQVQQALEEDRTLFEHNATVRPLSDLGMYLAGAVDWPGRETSREWLRRNDSFRPARHLRGPCRRATSRTPAWVPWVRRGGPATAMSPRCWSTS